MKLMVVFGTRPEVIKLAPVIEAARHLDGIELLSCSTGQHRQMLDQALACFGLQADIDLGLIEGPCHESGLEVLPWQRDALVIVAAAASPLPDTVDVAALAAARWLCQTWPKASAPVQPLCPGRKCLSC